MYDTCISLLQLSEIGCRFWHHFNKKLIHLYPEDLRPENGTLLITVRIT